MGSMTRPSMKYLSVCGLSWPGGCRRSNMMLVARFAAGYEDCATIAALDLLRERADVILEPIDGLELIDLHAGLIPWLELTILTRSFRTGRRCSGRARRPRRPSCVA